MNKDELKRIFKVLQIAYPEHCDKLGYQGTADTMGLYYSKFKDYPAEAFAIAVNNHIDKSKFFPKISELRDSLQELIMLTADNEVTPEQQWGKIVKAASDSTYHSAERFTELPEVCQRFLGSPAELKSLARANGDSLSYTRADFLKRYLEIKEQIRMKSQLKELSDKAKAQITNLTEEKEITGQ